MEDQKNWIEQLIIAFMELQKRIEALENERKGIEEALLGSEQQFFRLLTMASEDLTIRQEGKLFETNETLMKIVESSRDIFERKRREEVFKINLERIERVKEEWESTVDSLSHLVCLLDEQVRIIRANRTLENWNLGQVIDVRGRGMHEVFHPGCMMIPCYLEMFCVEAKGKLARGEAAECEAEDPFLNKYFSFQIQPIAVHTKKVNKTSTGYAVAIIHDISVRKKVEGERERLFHELQNSLPNAKTLQGMIPICASCKQIRDDLGNWNQIERYIENHAKVKFTHGICPECMNKLYGDILSKD